MTGTVTTQELFDRWVEARRIFRNPASDPIASHRANLRSQEMEHLLILAEDLDPSATEAIDRLLDTDEAIRREYQS